MTVHSVAVQGGPGREMALIYDEVMAKVETDLPFSYTDRDTILYALSVGFF